MPNAAVSGLAATSIAVGAVLAVSGIKNATLSDTLRALLKGEPVPGQSVGSLGKARESATADVAGLGAQISGIAGAAGQSAVGVLGAGGEAAGAAAGLAGRGGLIATYAAQYLGRPYVFGAAGPNAFDCSGLVTWVLHHDMGINLPSNTHTVTGQWYVWSGATTIPRDQCQAGDLVCWTSHIGIAISPTQMIHAPHPGTVVKTAKIYNVPPPIIRRLK
jgi:cell wall-associated NlpC family hydrolase